MTCGIGGVGMGRTGALQQAQTMVVEKRPRGPQFSFTIKTLRRNQL